MHDKKVRANKSLMEIITVTTCSVMRSGTTIKMAHYLFISSPEKLIISNTGEGSFDFRQVIKRFHKSDGSEGIGLGLTLCKQICDNYGFRLDYDYTDNIHIFSITF
jgi:hypothetical protein